MKSNEEIRLKYLKFNPKKKGPGPLIKEVISFIVIEWKGKENSGWFRNN